MRVFDTVLLGSEPDLDMLECRLTELGDSPVHRFVVSEARLDHQGHPKPLYLHDSMSRFSPWADRIHLVEADISGFEKNWDREVAQREALGPALVHEDIAPDDTVLHGDVDEIPDAVFPVSAPGGYDQVLCYFAADWIAPVQPWRGTVAKPWRTIQNFWHTRWDRHSPPRIGGGFHFTWIGGPDAIRAKLDMTPHGEQSFLDYMRKGSEEGTLWEKGMAPRWVNDEVPGGERCHAVDVDERWPRWIYQRRCPPVWFRPRGES